ncbi:cytochrome c-type biogenesis protein CcsB [Carboxydocella sporoproducens DSM 16521]|uniref:Cytochrome c-type biogenesis protein CcsB n=2 Tax=Carboxydocella TaxID=178898 RepID=A0A1T4MLU9_9FIRM|nr:MULTISPECIES: cytochrome c biogenesis protein CcsA [Carboxydocella]AVX21380.1 cytochrome c-type biogenesis protein CcsB [Carboxydocella thermautotrophica]SJZ67754.1 cytochrome c-type biogenesis protein CcsB [Carboxydocella sporoproducens DSM 16521]
MIIEGTLLWIAMFTYLFSFAAFLASVVFKKSQWTDWGWHSNLLAFAAHTGAIIWRWWQSGHPPVEGNYENSLMGAWAIHATYIFGAWKTGRFKALGVLVNPLIIFILGVGMSIKQPALPLSPPYQSNWLWIHVGFAWLAFGSFLIAAFLAVVYLTFQPDKAGKWQAFIRRNFPVPEILAEIILGLLLFGFISQGLMIAAGAIWAHSLWGAYWSWDPIEIWSLICWLMYGLVIHWRLTLKCSDRRLAWLAVLAVITVVITFWGIGMGTGVHTPLL